MTNYIVYRISILNNRKEKQILNYFNGSEDLLNICNDYYVSLKEEKVTYFDNSGNKRTFSITSKIVRNDKERLLVTHFDSAYTGKEIDIRDGNSNLLNYAVGKDELQSRKLFSHAYFPANAKYAYIVFENKSNLGVKVIFEQELQKFLNRSGFTEYRVKLEPALNFHYLSNMLDKGKLKKIRLINYLQSNDIQLSLWKRICPNTKDQKVEEFKFSNKTENDLIKFELSKLFFSQLNVDEKIFFMSKYEVDEISFEINYKGASKTFYLKNKNGMRANIDVSNRLKYLGGEPTYESMKDVSLDLIYETIGYGLSSFDNVA
ncbi:hypothetical protein [Winogradskyella undariae]|uniref:hypothetical protein n=1 Tax=Winogradskyella undariae TaxID=1285465 RepID=UPI0015C6F6A2|nr:hypothetical protein [Winogradskyella undariae]